MDIKLNTLMLFVLFLFLFAGNGCGCYSIRDAPMTTEFPLIKPNTVTYIGHATLLLRMDGITVLTDPLYREYVVIYRRYLRPGVPFEDLPKLDVILISHDHRDHLDKSTLKRIRKNVVMIVPHGLQKTIKGMGFLDVRGLKKWETTNVRGTEFTAVPAQHWGTCCGYLIHKDGKTVYFAGDTGLFNGMKMIGEKYPIDVALLPIGGYKPHLWFIPGLSVAMRKRHMAPEDVPTAANMLGSALVVPIHWGTFKLTGEPIDEPLERLQRIVRDQNLEGKVRIVLQGQTINF